MKKGKRLTILVAAIVLMATFSTGCGKQGAPVKLNRRNPVTVSVWHYYNGAIMNAFETMVTEFNETVGEQMGIIVEGYGMGNLSELEKAVISSANKEVGSQQMPNIFATYADTAYQAEKMGLLANLDDYFSEEEQAEYIDSYIQEGKIGLNGELKIFPIAKSTEIMMLNETDWLPFAEACGFTYDDLSTMEGVARVAETYYKWTDEKTPSIQNDGKAFFGRDSMANFFIIASKEYDTEIFSVENGEATINVNREVMRKIWDNYYVPYISGHFFAYGKFRSDDAKVGDILAYVGSTASVSYFPTEITTGGKVYPVEAKALPAPHFSGAKNVLVQQGAGMAVTKSTPQEEYASVVFLKWFTDAKNNIEFAALSGYMPVKKSTNDYDVIKAELKDGGVELDDIKDKTLAVALVDMARSELYTNKAFDGGVYAREVLEKNLQEKALKDREAVLGAIGAGVTLRQAIEAYNTEDNFTAWLNEFTQMLNAAPR